MTARRILIFFLCMVILCFWQMAVFGQPPGNPPGDPPDPDIPISGLEYLIGGGVLYGIRALLKARKKDQ